MQYTKDEMLDSFEVLGFAYGLCIVKEKATGKKGTLDFGDVDGIRYYYNFQEA
jgi:hypothetical protein